MRPLISHKYNPRNMKKEGNGPNLLSIKKRKKNGLKKNNLKNKNN